MSMAFGSAGGNPFGAAANSNAGSAQNGPDLQDIQTEALGFLSIAGEAKLRLLPTPWPADNLPPPTANLLSIASHKGLVAAAGPDAVIVASTEAVRKSFEGPGSGDSEIRPFQPQLSIPMSMRISQVAFTADENYLVLSAETGGGLAVYEVQSLLNGSTQSAFELPTNSQALRALIPNPTAEKGELLAIVTKDGDLLMANLKEKSFISGPNGQILKNGVSCVSWSTKGKQLVAGLGNGSAYQMTPEGEGKAEIPKPPSVEGDAHVSSITWLENHVFLVGHTPTSFDQTLAPDSIFHIVNRQPPSNFTFHKISQPIGPFGLNRSPPHHFILRLKDFPPNLQDALVVASTASTDIGLFTRSKTPLTSSAPADQITGVFTMTELADDSRRAQLPMTEEMTDTSPIGIALDLSATGKVEKPIPGEEMTESATPVPLVTALNHEGVLSAWWFIYSESIRAATAYPGLVSAGAQISQPQPQTQQVPATSSPFGAPSASSAPAFGQSAFGSSSNNTSAFGSFNKPAAPAFGAPSALGSTPAFGQSAFGSTSALGGGQSPWGTSTSNAGNSSSTPAFGKPSTPAFGAPSMSGAGAAPAFGSTTTIGNRSSPWGSAASTATAFGKPSTFGSGSSFGGSTGGSAFGSSAVPSSGGFASFANKGGFNAISENKSNAGASIFGSKTDSSPSPFGTTTDTIKDSVMGTGSTFGTPGNEKPTGPFGTSGGFSLTSSFKPDPSENEPGPKPSTKETSFFGSGFGNALGAPSAAPQANEAEMGDVNQETPAISTPAPPAAPPATSTTPFTSPAAPKSIFQTSTAPTTGGIFGNLSQPKPANEAPKQFTSLWGAPTITATQPAEQTAAASPKPAETTNLPKTPEIEKRSPSPKIKEEPVSDDEQALQSIPEAPLPPDPTSRPSYAAGDTSISSTETEPPLPPDFTKTEPQKSEATPNVPPIPDDQSAQETKPAFDPAMVPPLDVPVGSPSGEALDGPSDQDDGSDFGSLEDDERNEEPGSGEEGSGSEEGSVSGSDEESDEGSGVDVAKDISPSTLSSKTVGITPESSFGALSNRSPESVFTKIQKPNDQGKSLFGEVPRFGQNAPVFAPPSSLKSPRSPSPVRSIPGRLVRPESSRSVSAPGMASDLLASRMGPPPVKHHMKSPLTTIEQREQEARNQVKSKAQKEAEELQGFFDREADAMEEHLKSDIIATKVLDEFVAHQDYVGESKGSSVPAHVEIVYRDINSMIDTLGVNSRSLEAFIKGHTELYKDPGRTREDLEDDDDWCLVEIEDLSSIIDKDLSKQLDAGRVKDIDRKRDDLREVAKDLVRLHAKHEDVKKLISSLSDPEHLAAARSQPLSSEQAAQQHDIRKDFTKVQKLLAETEEGLTNLKAALASHSNSKPSGTAVPTVEAVVRTIKKMTNMAEKRSGDVDLLENQMRKLRLSSVESPSSREGSPFATPQKKTSTRQAGRESTYGLFYTPESAKGTPTSRNLRASTMSAFSPSRGSATPPRKKLNGFSDEEKSELKKKLEKRKGTNDKLRLALQRTGGKVRGMDDK